MKSLLMFLLLNLSTTIFAGSLENTLQHHASPYLAMHGDDPVAWQEWNKITVDKAKKEGKLIYVSSGYFSCHWCHVMQRESYKNADVAKILNKYFVPVKVDREINSALDSRLIEFVERTQGRAGWPLNVFITPDGYPLVGMTYVPTSNFIEILNNLKIKWQQEKAMLEKIAKDATDELTAPVIKRSSLIPAGITNKYIDLFLSGANEITDDMSGGFGQQNKFPSFPQLSALLTLYKAKPDKELKRFLLLTLNKMASQGLNDQLSGGFFRYSVDPNWQVPHFEKMLYDNALLASLYLEAARIFKNEKFSRVAKDTLDFMLDVFRSPKGAYIASLSAVDDKDVEGGYYLWQSGELKKILNKNEMKLIELMWQLEGPDDLEGGHHLVEVMNVVEAAEMLKMPVIDAKKYFNTAKKKMLLLREKRRVPRDDKLLAAWNGLTLSAYAKAAKQFNNKTYAKAATDIKNYIYKNLWKNKTLYRAVKNKKILGEGGLEDYAYVAQGISDWLEYKSNAADKKWLDDLIAQSWKRFHGDKGWLLAENMLLKYGQGEEVLSDGVLPSPSAILIKVSLRHGKNDPKLITRSLEALNSGKIYIEEQAFWYASQILTMFHYKQGKYELIAD